MHLESENMILLMSDVFEEDKFAHVLIKSDFRNRIFFQGLSRASPGAPQD